MVEIGTYLKQLRGGLSLREAAKRSGLGHTSIASLEAGSRKPSPEALRDLAKAYNHPYEQLMEKAGYIDLQNKNSDPLVNEKELVSAIVLSDEDTLNNSIVIVDGVQLSERQKRKLLAMVRLDLLDSE